jgi:hypothetical protein
MVKRHHRNVPKNNPPVSQSIRQLQYPKEFRIPNDASGPEIEELQQELEVLKTALQQLAEQSTSTANAAADYSEQMLLLLHLLAEVATGLWRTQQRMVQPGTSEPLEAFKRAYRPLQSTLDTLQQAGLEMIDRTNRPYAVGLSEKVIAYETSPNLAQETIIETIKPSIYYQGHLLQLGEIIVGQPEPGTAAVQN